LVNSTIDFNNLVIYSMDYILQQDSTVTGDLNLSSSTLDLNGTTLTVEGNLYQTGGELKVNNGKLIVKGDYIIDNGDSYSSGKLFMINDSDYVKVEGNFVMDSSYDHSSYLTAGILEIKGNFTQRYAKGNGYTNFYASGTHKTIFSGSSKQTVYFQTPNASYSHFNILEITNTSSDGVEFISRIIITQLFNHHQNPFTLSDETNSYFNDYDEDGVNDNLDPYPTDNSINSSQDSDNDGILDDIEGTDDYDNDGTPNYLDSDSDADGISDAIEYGLGLDALDETDALADNDGDGVSNIDEIKAGTSIGDKDDYPATGLSEQEKALFLILMNRSNQLNQNQGSSTYLQIPTPILIEAMKEEEMN